MMWARGAVICLMLQACGQTTSVPQPLTMPPADGRAQIVKLSPKSFVVSRRANTGVTLRVTRIDGRDLDYSDGLLAKRAAAAYCATFNRPLDPAAMGHFSQPNAWLFDGDCL